jgi:hypothetical protein
MRCSPGIHCSAGLPDRGSPKASPPARDVDYQVHDEHDRGEQVPPVERPWEGGQEQGGSPIPVEDPRNHDVDRDECEDRIRRQETYLAHDLPAKAPQPREHPSDPAAALCQVDHDQACEGQPHVGMDGVADMEELQGPECRRGEH